MRRTAALQAHTHVEVSRRELPQHFVLILLQFLHGAPVTQILLVKLLGDVTTRTEGVELLVVSRDNLWMLCQRVESESRTTFLSTNPNQQPQLRIPRSLGFGLGGQMSALPNQRRQSAIEHLRTHVVDFLG